MNNELNYRIQIVKNIFDMCIKINLQGTYYAFCQISPHVGTLSTHITPAHDFQIHIANIRDAHYICDWLSHEDMKRELAYMYTTLSRYYAEEDDICLINLKLKKH